MSEKPSYFLASLSNKENLDLCMKYSLAGFTNSINGVWAFLEVTERDFVSFLYGARVYNLYRVRKKEAINKAENLPPWKPVTFLSGRTYYFPFRLDLEPIRRFEESLVRVEFAYVAENLLLRGGYRKTHFQADQTTLQNASQMGSLHLVKVKELEMQGYETFTPKFTLDRSAVNPPKVFKLQEIILQTIIRQHLCKYNNLRSFLRLIDVDDLDAKNLEVLGEKALPEGHVDILIKEAIPIGVAKKIILEIKFGRSSKKDVEQLDKYAGELGKECISACLIAREIPKAVISKAKEEGLHIIRYNLPLNKKLLYTFDELKERIRLESVV